MSATNPWPNRTGVYASPTLFLLPKVALFRIWATIGRGRSSALEHSPPQLSCERARERHTKLGRNPQVSEGFRIDIINSELRNHQGTMVATATMVGAIMGLSCQLYSNGVRKLPLMRRKHLPSTLKSHVYTHSFLPLLFRSIYETSLKIRCILPLPFGWSPLLQSFCFFDN